MAHQDCYTLREEGVEKKKSVMDEKPNAKEYILSVDGNPDLEGYREYLCLFNDMKCAVCGEYIEGEDAVKPHVIESRTLLIHPSGSYIAMYADGDMYGVDIHCCAHHNSNEFDSAIESRTSEHTAKLVEAWIKDYD